MEFNKIVCPESSKKVGTAKCTNWSLKIDNKVFLLFGDYLKTNAHLFDALRIVYNHMRYHYVEKLALA